MGYFRGKDRGLIPGLTVILLFFTEVGPRPIGMPHTELSYLQFVVVNHSKKKKRTKKRLKKRELVKRKERCQKKKRELKKERT